MKIVKVEGTRIERRVEADFLTSFVRLDKQDGKYFNEVTGKGDVWNIDVSRSLNVKLRFR